MITTYMKNTLLDMLFRNVEYNNPTTLYIALSKTTPTEAGGNCTEPTAESYARLGVASNTINWEAASSGSITNAVDLKFPEAEETWTTTAQPITCWAMYDAVTGGNMLFYGSLIDSQEIPKGAILEIPEGGLVTTIINQS